MANEGPRAYDFEPAFTQEELALILMEIARNKRERVLEERDFDLPQEPNRLLNDNWCHCTNCRVMPTITECRCCQEIRNIDALISGHGRISNHEDFETVCLNKAVLRAVLIMRNDVRGHDANVERELGNKSYRYSAYRMFTYWIHGRLGKGVRKVVPSCAVRKIREKFPDPQGQYVGLIYGEGGEELVVGEVEAI